LKKVLQILSFIIALIVSAQAYSHHVLGRPAYSLNEDSNTPPAMNIETQVGNYYISAMVYPAFPRPNEPGRINFYATQLDSGEPLNTGVTFKVRNDNWFNSEEEKLGAQVLDDNVYRQGFMFREEGDYIITAEFFADGETYTIDFPMRVGSPFPLGPFGIGIVVVILVLVGVSVLLRKRLIRARIQIERNDRSINTGQIK
jgi:hypothetical protein